MNTERHPFTPFLPDGCRLLMLGSFPPGEQRWSMRFYYPNFTNDMWRIFGLCFFNDKLHFVDTEAKTFRLDRIIPFLNERRIGMYDTATVVRRLKVQPKVGENVQFGFDDRTLRLWRMPSSSRAYPMKPERKAEFYSRMFSTLYDQA